ncbi:hypothetical protein IC582_000496 [Cucumis melo]
MCCTLIVSRWLCGIGFWRCFAVDRCLIGPWSRSFRRWCGSVVAKKSLWQQNFVYHKNGQWRLLSELVVDRYRDNAGGNVDLVGVRLAGEVQPPISGLSPYRIADGKTW